MKIRKSTAEKIKSSKKALICRESTPITAQHRYLLPLLLTIYGCGPNSGKNTAGGSDPTALDSDGLGIARPIGTPRIPPASPLPTGIPTTTSNKSKCVSKEEQAEFEKYLDTTRVQANGCTKGILPAQKTLVAQHSSIGKNKVNCIEERENYFMVDDEGLPTGHLNYRHAKEFVAEVDKSMGLQKVGVPALTGKEKTDAAKCAVSMLDTWSKADAFSVVAGTRSNQDANYRRGAVSRAWLLNGIFNAYFKSTAIQNEARRRKVGHTIKSWLHKLGRKVAQDMNLDVSKGNNNRKFWMANTVLMAGLLTKDKDLITKSKAAFNLALREIKDGFLEPELARKEKALHYHHFAAVPILSMAALSNSYGCDFANSPWKRRQLVALAGQALLGNLDKKQSFIKKIEEFFKNKEGREIKFQAGKIKKGGFTPEIVLLTQKSGPKLLRWVNDFLESKGYPRYPENYSKKDDGKNAEDFRLGGNLNSLFDQVENLKDMEIDRLKPVCGK